jgi:predicted amidohydrolase
MKVASVQFSLRPIAEDKEFWGRIYQFVTIASAENADCILFPEYFSLSWILSKFPGEKFRAALLKSAQLESEFLTRFQALCESDKITIIAGTHPQVEGDNIFNRSWIFQPGKYPIHQDKVNMTRFESEAWNISPGKRAVQTFQMAGATCAVAICYDVEFPSYAAAAAEAKTELLFVPSCTDDVHGYWRVRHCAEARAIENQSYVLTSGIVEGNANYLEIESHYGEGVLLSPCDLSFPAGGLISKSKANEENMFLAELDLHPLREVRKSGTVLNLRDSENTEPMQVLI